MYTLVTPHLNPKERQETAGIVEKFRRNEGPKLQQLLQERAKTHKNWVGTQEVGYNCGS